jgi:flagellar motor switch protein FliN/FliY
VSQLDAVRRSAELTATALAEVIGELAGAPGSTESLQVDDTADKPWDALEFPLVCIRTGFTGALNGDYLFVLTQEQARVVAVAMGMGEADAEGDLNDIELSAVAEALNQTMAKVADALADATGAATELTAPTTDIIASKEKAEAFGEASYTARFTVRAGTVSASIVQVVPAEFAAILETSFGGAEPEAAEADADEAPEEPAAEASGATLAAVGHTAGIIATSSAEVLTTLIGEAVTATAPAIEEVSADPLGQLTYPRVMVEVAYLSGVEGATLFVLAPNDSATLAAVMMGLDAPMGDGLSELELSAVAEAMSQMMGAAATDLGAHLGVDVAIAPPVCTLVEDPGAARTAFPHSAYSSRFQIVSERLTAEVLHLLPTDLALRLEQCFAASDADPGARPVRSASATATTNAAAARATPGALGFDSLRDVQVRVSAELGRARVPVSDVMNLPPGAIVELDRLPNETIDILVNGRAFARARLVLVDGEYAAQIVSLEPPILMAG